MADIKIRFEVNPNQETEKLGKVINENAIVSNVSYKVDDSGEFTIISSGEHDGSNGLSFAKDLVFDAQGFLDNEDLLGAVLESEDEPTEFVWGVVPSNGVYSVKVTFSNATNLKDIVVYGDKVVGQYPTRAIIDGKTVITNDDYKWAINLETESDTHTIEFTNWSRVNYNACLTLIRVMFRYFEVGKRTGLKTIESLSQLSGQPKELYYGVIPSSGSVELIDNHGEFEDLLVDEVIPNSNLHIEVFANGRKIQNHLSIDSDYGSDRILRIELSNGLSGWDKIKFTGMRLVENKSLLDVLRYIFRNVGIIENDFDVSPMLKGSIFYDGLYVSIEDYLANIKIPYAYLNPSTLRDAVDKVCQLAQLNVVEDYNGDIRFISARPIIDTAKPIITINPSQIKTMPTRDVILKNKYKGISLTQNKPSDIIEYNQTAYMAENLPISSLEEYSVGSGKGCVSSPVFQGWGARILQKNYYTSGSFVVPKDSDDGLKEILSLKEKDSDGKFLSYSVVATKTTGDCINNYFTINTTNTENATPSSYGTITESNPSSTELVTITLDTSEISVVTDKAQASISPQNQSSITVTKNSYGDFVVDYKVLAKQETWTLSANGTTAQQS